MQPEPYPLFSNINDKSVASYPVRGRNYLLHDPNEDFTNRRAHLLGILFDASCPKFSEGPDVLRPFWVNEAMHRASNMLNLVLLLEHQSWCGTISCHSPEYEYDVAMSLAAAFRAIEEAVEIKAVPCKEVLWEVVSGLVDLFGPLVGGVALKTNLAPLALPSQKRRALILLASELVTNCLKHAFRGSRNARILVSLTPAGKNGARFTVEDNGHGFTSSRPSAAFGIVAALGGVLEADLTYRRSPLGGTIAELEFPIG